MSLTSSGRKVSTTFLVVFLLGVVLTGVWLRWGRYYLARESARYSETYIRDHAGRATYEIPEMYELGNIAIAITDYGLQNPNRVYKDSDYYQRVLAHFLPYRDHPLIAAIEFSDERLGAYTSFRDNAVAYAFDDGGSIVPTDPYRVAKNVDLFGKHRALVESFAQASDFRAFYRENLPYYEGQIALYREQLPVEEVWRWMEQQFPQRYDSYKIIFSPLIGATHRTANFADNGFSESVMFLAGPDFAHGRSPDGNPLLLTQLAFTEVTHNYVNPTTLDYLDEIKAALADLDTWNRQSNYRSRRETFNEYMTWALFTLYLDDHYPEERVAEQAGQLNRMMVEQRRFVRFPLFNQRLLDLYRNRGEGETVIDIFPDIIAWMATVE